MTGPEISPSLILNERIQPGDTVLFIGERQHESDNPSGPGFPESGYFRRFRDLLLAHNPGAKFTLIDRTEFGQTATGLADSWEDDVNYHQPQWLIVSVGVIEATEVVEKGKPEAEVIERYAMGLDHVLSQTESVLDAVRIVLVAPALPSINDSPYKGQAKTLSLLARFAEVLRELAAKYQCGYVPLQDVYRFALEHFGRECLGTDPLHPNQFGTILKAESISRAAAPRPAHLGQQSILFAQRRPRHPALDTGMDETETWLFIGDSITDSMRRQNRDCLGLGYVRLCHELYRARHPENCIQWVNRGISGNTIGDLEHRWQHDCLDHQPDRVTVKIGINDQVAWMNGRLDLSPKRYEEIYRGLLTRTRRALHNPRFLLVSPFYITRETDRENNHNARMRQAVLDYVSAVEKVATEFDAEFLNMQERFEAHLASHHYKDFSGERIHPNETGAMILAEAVYSRLVA